MFVVERNSHSAGFAFLAIVGVLLSVGCSGSVATKPEVSTVTTTEERPIQSPPISAPAFPSIIAKQQLPTVTDVSARLGLKFVDRAEKRQLRHVWPDQPHPMTALEAFGLGCAAFDSDNDGWQDVLLVDSPGPAFFRNIGGRSFQDLTQESGLLAVSGRWTGASVGDFDGDGLQDVLLTGYHQLALYKNLDGLRFRDVTAAAGLDPANGGFWAASAGFMDLDGDAWLDLVILNYVIFGPETKKYCEYPRGIISGCGPRSDLPEFGQIFRNTGNQTFELVPAEQAMKHTHGVAMVLAFTDLDDDGRMDFYIGNDGVPADLLHNQGQFRFENIAAVAGVATSDNGRPISAMAADWSDFDRDGKLDLIVTNWFDLSSALFQNLGNQLFVDCAKSTDLARITRNRLGFGAKWVDFENDGWPDLFIVNGHVNHDSAEIHGPDVPYRQAAQLLWNHEGKRFLDVVPQLGADVQRSMVGRGNATADFDNDGKVDLLAVDFEGPVMLLMNETESKHHWLKLDLRGKSPNVFAYGARVIGKAGNQVWIAELSPASSYLSSSDPRIHWGLGDVTELDKLTIRWPSGKTTTLENVPVDRIMSIAEDSP